MAQFSFRNRKSMLIVVSRLAELHCKVSRKICLGQVLLICECDAFHFSFVSSDLRCAARATVSHNPFIHATQYGFVALMDTNIRGKMK